jgi:hypothetical protein
MWTVIARESALDPQVYSKARESVERLTKLIESMEKAKQTNLPNIPEDQREERESEYDALINYNQEQLTQAQKAISDYEAAWYKEHHKADLETWEKEHPGENLPESRDPAKGPRKVFWNLPPEKITELINKVNESLAQAHEGFTTRVNALVELCVSSIQKYVISDIKSTLSVKLDRLFNLHHLFGHNLDLDFKEYLDALKKLSSEKEYHPAESHLFKKRKVVHGEEEKGKRPKAENPTVKRWEAVDRTILEGELTPEEAAIILEYLIDLKALSPESRQYFGYPGQATTKKPGAMKYTQGQLDEMIKKIETQQPTWPRLREFMSAMGIEPDAEWARLEKEKSGKDAQKAFDEGMAYVRRRLTSKALEFLQGLVIQRMIPLARLEEGIRKAVESRRIGFKQQEFREPKMTESNPKLPSVGELIEPITWIRSFLDSPLDDNTRKMVEDKVQEYIDEATRLQTVKTSELQKQVDKFANTIQFEEAK